jgi:hypothetical protein
MEGMKKSDRKKYEKAWEGYNKQAGEFAKSLDRVLNLPDNELRLDEVNQLTACVEKVTKKINNICDCHHIKE